MRLDCMARTARFMTSGLIGVAKTRGSSIFPTGLPSRLKILAVFLGIVVHRLFSLRRFERNERDLRRFLRSASWRARWITQSYCALLRTCYSSIQKNVWAFDLAVSNETAFWCDFLSIRADFKNPFVVFSSLVVTHLPSSRHTVGYVVGIPWT